MGYNRENYSKVKREIDMRRERALEEAKLRLEELHLLTGGIGLLLCVGVGVIILLIL